MLNAPCKDCEKRYPACHSSCDLYKEWETKNSERRKLIQKLRGQERSFKGRKYV